MTAFNAVRFRVKLGRDKDFLDAHLKVESNWAGLRHANIIKTGDHSYCIVAEWSDMDSLVAARPHMETWAAGLASPIRCLALSCLS